MHFAVALFAYVTAAAAGIQALALSADFIATSASGALQLPQGKPSQASLVDRRLATQTAPVSPKAPVREVRALAAPRTPAALLAAHLDEAETAYVPPAEMPATKSASHRAPLVRNVHARAERSANLARVTQATGKASLKRKPGNKRQIELAFNSKKAKPQISQTANILDNKGFGSRKPMKARQFVAAETPGYLMRKGLLAQQS